MLIHREATSLYCSMRRTINTADRVAGGQNNSTPIVATDVAINTVLLTGFITRLTHAFWHSSLIHVTYLPAVTSPNRMRVAS